MFEIVDFHGDAFVVTLCPAFVDRDVCFVPRKRDTCHHVKAVLDGAFGLARAWLNDIRSSFIAKWPGFDSGDYKPVVKDTRV